MNMLDLEELSQRAQKIACSVIERDTDKLDSEGRWPREGLKALMEAGLGGLVVPTSLGGQGQGLFALTKICEIIGRVCPSTALCYGMHSVGTAVLAANPGEYQIETFLKPICRGEHITTLSLSEPGSGAHFYLPQTTIRRSAPGTYVANGVKTFVTNGGHANSYVISGVNTDNPEQLEEMSCFILPADSLGMTWGEEWKGFGMRGNSSRTLNLKDVRIDEKYLLGKEGDQIWYMFHVVAPWFLMAMAGTYLGIANEALTVGQKHVQTRHHTHNDRGLASLPVIQHCLARLWARLQMTQQLVFHAAHLFDSGDETALAFILSSKAEVADTVISTVNEIMTLTGGIGYREYGKLGKMLRDARAVHVMSPTTDILRLWVGRILLEQPILGDE